eukprot:350758-Chlamydomonas_euryale.AAC.11
MTRLCCLWALMCERPSTPTLPTSAGNGTHHMFDDDPSVLFVSIHQDGNYPARSGWVLLAQLDATLHDPSRFWATTLHGMGRFWATTRHGMGRFWATTLHGMGRFWATLTWKGSF